LVRQSRKDVSCPIPSRLKKNRKRFKKRKKNFKKSKKEEIKQFKE